MSVRSRLAELLVDAPADAQALEFHGQWWSWGQLRDTARSLGSAMDDIGVQADGRVGVVLENRPELVAVVLAVLTSGRCLVALNGLQPAARLASDVDGARVGAVIAAESTLRTRAGVRDAIGSRALLVVGADGVTVTEGVMAAVQVAEDARPGVSIEMLTSGTTGPAKRVSLTDTQLDVAMASGGMRPGRAGHLSSAASIVMTPLVHIGGLWGVLSTLYCGRRIILLDRFELEPWVRAVEIHRPRASGLVPAAIRMVLDADVPPERLASLQVVTTGTAACPVELAEAFLTRYGITVLDVYGATEFAGAVAGWTLPMHAEWWGRKKGSAGRAFRGVELRITDADGAVLDSGRSGHLEIKSRQAPNGAAGWVRTSDFAHLDSDGFLWIEGRSDNMIIRGGFKIAPDAVKMVLESHPAVREAGIAARPDPRLGSVPVAAVELVEGASVEPVELVSYCRARLLPYEIPAELRIVDALPRTASMKISQVDLLEMFEADAGESVAS